MVDSLIALAGLRGAERAVAGGQVISCPLRYSGRVGVDRCLVCPWATIHRQPNSERVTRVRCGAPR